MRVKITQTETLFRKVHLHNLSLVSSEYIEYMVKNNRKLKLSCLKFSKENT